MTDGERDDFLAEPGILMRIGTVCDEDQAGIWHQRYYRPGTNLSR